MEGSFSHTMTGDRDRGSRPGATAGATAQPQGPKWAAIAPPRPRVALVWLLAVPAFAFAVIVAGFALGVRGDRLTILAIAMLTLTVCLVPLALDQGRPGERRHTFISLLGVIFMIHYVLPALVFYVPGTGGVPAPGLDTDVWPRDAIRGQLVGLAGLTALLVSYALPIGRYVGFFLPKPKYDWSPNATFGIACGLLALGWFVTALGIVGLIPRWAGTGLIGMFALYYVFSNALFALLLFRYNAQAVLVVLIPNLLLSFTYGLFTSRKIEMLIGPTIVLLTFMLWTGRIRMRWFAAGALAIALIYPISEFVRWELDGKGRIADLITSPAETLSTIATFASKDDSDLLAGLEATAGRLDGLGVTSVIARDTPSLVPFQNGRTLWLFFVAFVPRGLWAEKPQISLGGWITETYGPGNNESATGPTQIGDLYLNFGWTSVVLGMALLGLILRVSYETLFKRRTAAAMLVQVMIVFWLIVRFEGNVGQLWSSLVFALSPVVLAHIGARLFLNLPAYVEGQETGAKPAVASHAASAG